MIWCISPVSQYPCLNHIIWTTVVIKNNQVCHKGSFDWFRNFLVQIIELSIDEEDSCPHCHQLTRQIPFITFFPEDMQVKNMKHNGPLYYKGILVQPRWTKSNWPRFYIEHYSTKINPIIGHLHKLAGSTNTTIYWASCVTSLMQTRLQHHSRMFLDSCRHILSNFVNK